LSIASSKEHTMADTYSTQAPQPAKIPNGKVRPLLWLVLVISGVVNVVTSVTIGSTLIANAFGLIALASIVALINYHYRHRR
jgi:heme A synthase